MNQKPLKVLLVFGHRNKLGSIRMIVPLERALKKHGIDLFFSAESRGDFKDYPELADRVAEVKGLTDWRSLRGKLTAVPVVLKLMRLVENNEVDVLYAYHLSTFPYVLAVSRLARIPHLVAVQNVYRNKDRYAKFLLHHAKNVLGVSQFMLDFTKEYAGNGITEKYVVYNGIDIDAFLSSATNDNLPAPLRSPKKNTVVGMVSAMDRHKDPQFLLRVARTVIDVEPNVVFAFVGRFPDPEYEKETMDLAKHLNLESNVIFCGQQNNISPFFAAFDILAHPRPAVPEAFGLVLIEAMAHGKPVVASNIGGIPEVVRHNETGFLCTPGDKEQFAETLLRLVRKPRLREDFGQCGYKRVREIFSIEKTAMDMAKVLWTIADKSRGGDTCHDEITSDAEAGLYH